MFKQNVRYVGKPVKEICSLAPTKIVVLTPHFVDYLLTLDIVPVGVVSEDDHGTKFDGCIVPIQHVVTSVGKSKSPQIDKIKALQPDLILGEGKKHIHLYKELEKIAPTILIKDLSVDWKKVLHFLSKIFNKEKQAEQKLAELEIQVAGQKASFQRFFDTKTILLANVWKKDGFQVHNYDSHLGKIIYQKLELTKSKPLQIDQKYHGYKYMFPKSLEKIAELDPDYLLLFNTEGKKQQEIMEEIQKSIVWQNLACVKQNQVVYLGELKDGNEGKCVNHYSKIVNEISKQTVEVTK